MANSAQTSSFYIFQIGDMDVCVVIIAMSYTFIGTINVWFI